MLYELSRNGLPNSEIAKHLQRSTKAVERKRRRQKNRPIDLRGEPDPPGRRGIPGQRPGQDIAMVVTDWVDLGGGVRQRLVYRADDAGIVG